MYSCYVHGWSHIERPCPICHAPHTISTDGTSIRFNFVGCPCIPKDEVHFHDNNGKCIGKIKNVTFDPAPTNQMNETESSGA